MFSKTFQLGLEFSVLIGITFEQRHPWEVDNIGCGPTYSWEMTETSNYENPEI